MLSKKTLFATGGILAIFMLLSASQGAMAATGLPTYLSTKATIHGYSLVYYNNINVTDFDNIKDANVTCWTTMWYRAANSTVNSSIIGASLVNAGGRILSKPINVTGTDVDSVLVKDFMLGAGLNSTTISGITNVWDLFVAMLQRLSLNSTGINNFTVQTLSLAKADYSLLITTPNRPYLQHILFAAKGPYMLLAFAYDLNNWTVDWTNSGNVTAMGAYIIHRFQSDVWFFWRIIGQMLVFFNRVSNFLTGSAAPAAATSTASSISIQSNTAVSDMQAFANDWASITSSSSIPGFEPALVFVAVAASGAMIVAFKFRKSKRT